MATVVNARDVILQAALPNGRVAGVTMQPNIAVDPSQVTGLGLIILGTKMVDMEPSSQVFQVNTAGTATPSSITLTLNLRNIVGTPSLSVISGTYGGSLTLSGGPAVYTRTIAFSDVSTDAVTIRASVTESSITYTDDITLVKARDGSNAVNAFLTNEAHTAPGDSAGNVTNYAGAGGTFKVYQGSTDVSASCTYAVQSNPNSVTTSINSTSGVYSVTAAYPTGVDVITVTYRATFGAATFDKVFTMSKARAGTNAFTLVPRGSVEVAGTTATYTSGGTGTWGSGDVYSVESFVGGAYSSARAAVTNRDVMFGLNTDPLADQTYTSLDFAWLFDGGGNCNVYENGTIAGSYGTYTTSTLLGITYDGQNVRYYKDGVLQHTTAAAANIRFYFDSAFANVGSGLVNIAFGPAGVRGSNGTNGQRGSRTFYISGISVWSDATATSTATVDGGPILNDVVTQYNTTNFSQTRFWNGTSWIVVNAVVDGNLLVSGTVGAAAIQASAVRSSHLLVTGGIGAAINADPTCVDPTAWTFPGGGGSLVTITDGVGGSGAIRLTGSAYTWSSSLPAVAGKTYKLSFYGRHLAGATTGHTTARLRYYNNAGSLLAFQLADIDSGWPLEDFTMTFSFVKYRGYSTAPAGTVSCIIEFYTNFGVSGSGEIQDARMEEQLDYSAIILGGLTADRIDTRNLTIKDGAGTVIFSAGVPLGTANAAAGLINSNVSINSAGVLSGAGGGTVTIGGLGYNGDLNATADVSLYQSVGTGHVISGNTVGYPSGGSFADNVATRQAQRGGAYCAFKPEAGAYYIAGLDSSPIAGATNMMYSVISRSDGNISYRESGAEGLLTTYVMGDVIGVEYDGSNVRYWKNGTLLRTVAAAGSLTLHFLCSIVSSSSTALSGIRFGPYGNPSAIQPSNPINSGNISTYIAAAAIGDAYIASLSATKITTGTMDAARITAGTITTDRLVANAATVASVGVSSYASYGWTAATTMTIPNTTCATITTTGTRVKIMVDCIVNVLVNNTSPRYGNVRVVLKMDGTAIATRDVMVYFPAISGGRYAQTTVPVIFAHTPSAASHTYSLEVSSYDWRADGGGAAISATGTAGWDAFTIVEENKV